MLWSAGLLKKKKNLIVQPGMMIFYNKAGLIIILSPAQIKIFVL